jgi:hypothetical protein
LAPLVLLALVLPIALCVILGLARLLAAMGDAAGAGVADRLALAGGVIWLLLLIAMIIVQALLTLDAPADEDDGEE